MKKISFECVNLTVVEYELTNRESIKTKCVFVKTEDRERRFHGPYKLASIEEPWFLYLTPEFVMPKDFEKKVFSEVIVGEYKEIYDGMTIYRAISVA